MVLVTVVMACCAKAQSAILRLFFAMRILRVFTAIPKPFNSACVKPIVKVDCTAGLKRLAVEVELVRVLFQLTNKLVPVSKPRDTWLLNCVVWVWRVVRVATPVPVPEMNGLLTGVERSSMKIVLVTVGS